MLLCVGLLIGCDGVVSMGVFNVTFLIALFCFVRVFSVIVAASLGSLSSRIPYWSDAAYDSNISEPAASLKM